MGDRTPDNPLDEQPFETFTAGALERNYYDVVSGTYIHVSHDYKSLLAGSHQIGDEPEKSEYQHFGPASKLEANKQRASGFQSFYKRMYKSVKPKPKARTERKKTVAPRFRRS